MRPGIFAVLAFLLFTPSQVLAGADSQRNDAMCPELARISLYVSFTAGFEHLDFCPPLIYSAADPLAQGPRRGRIAGPLRGTAFYPQTGAIQVSVQVDAATVTGAAQLVHAMVQAYQTKNGMDLQTYCANDLDRQALHVQAQFLLDNGYDAEAQVIQNLILLKNPCTPGLEAMR